MEILDFIMEEALILVPVLWILGTFLKRTPMIPDWTIVWMLLTTSIALTSSLFGLTVHAVLQGILVAGVAVLGHQMLKQTVER